MWALHTSAATCCVRYHYHWRHPGKVCPESPCTPMTCRLSPIALCRTGHCSTRRARRSSCRGSNVERKDLGRDMECATGIWNIDNTTDFAFTRRGTDEHIGLLSAVPKLLQVLDGIQAGTPVSNVGVQVILLALLIDGNALKDKIFRVAGFDGTGLKDRVDHAVLADSAFNEI